ncbi:MAG: hypothetical protein F6K19_49535 [Cyanothece sp. SIO1E1]|nr:hypothetical protein [Cyanothece sp. SIO1E1]
MKETQGMTTQMCKKEYCGSYTPKTVDTFNIGVRHDVALIQAYSTLPKSLYRDLFEFAIHYSPSGLVLLVEEHLEDQTSYAVYSCEGLIDMEWLTHALSRLDHSSWVFEDGIIYSPEDSRVSTKSLYHTFNVARQSFLNLNEEEQLKRVMSNPAA